MQRLMSLATMAFVLGGGGWMFLNGLHLENIDRIFVTSGTNSPSSGGSYGGGFTPSGAIPAPAPGMAVGGPTIRIATFNIQVFGDSKASKPYVMAELAKIVSQFDLVAIQEIRTQDDYFVPKFLQLVQQTSGRQWDYRVGPRLGNTTSTEQYAYVWDRAKIAVNPGVVYTISDPANMLHREPLVAHFRALVPDNYFSFMMVNCHTDPDVAAQEIDALAQVYHVVRQYSQGEDDILLVGDFNTNVPMTVSPVSGNLQQTLQPKDLGLLGQIPGLYPVVQAEPTNTARTRLHDNIFFHRPSTTEFTMRGGVYDIAKWHNLQPDQVAQISDHLPVWAEFSAYESGVPGQMASGGFGTQR